MKIDSSSITMASAHEYTSYTYIESMTIAAPASQNTTSAILSLSGDSDDESQSYLDSMKEYQRQQAAQQKAANNAKLTQTLEQASHLSDAKARFEMSDSYKLKLQLLNQLFDILKNGGSVSKSDAKYVGNGIRDLRSGSCQDESSIIYGEGVAVFSGETVSGGSPSVGTTTSGTLWEKVTATSGFSSEYESTTFASVGKVQTSDGRSIDFNIEVSMSRACMSTVDSLSSETYILTDPLMINLDTNIGTVSDQKFYFDIDSNGTEEEISFAGSGSGFLALDKNGDGVINDGSELFGTTSGDGFADLSAYDEDGNGWIDESDSVYSQLKVWTKDEEGNDILMNLQQADVGAIYLGNVDTDYTLKDSTNQTDGVLRQTGIYLKESTGAVGTINQVDLATY